MNANRTARATSRARNANMFTRQTITAIRCQRRGAPAAAFAAAVAPNATQHVVQNTTLPA